MNIRLSIYADSHNVWRATLSKLLFYAEEADVRLSGDLIGDFHAPQGVMITASSQQGTRLEEILIKAGLADIIHLAANPILPQHDPAEQKILEKLYTGGDTSTKPPEEFERPVPSEHPKYELPREEYLAELKQSGRRSKAGGGT